MTYCVAMRVDEGLVFLSDTRTNAGVDHVSTFRKMTVFEQPGERVLVLLTAGNLALTQSVVQLLAEPADPEQPTPWNVPNMFEAARLVGKAVREVYQMHGSALHDFNIDFNCSFLLGGQIRGQGMRLFQIYAAGNFIEASTMSPYFQIGEAKYGKPILDRVLTPTMPLDEAAKCALISMDSTLRSNVSVGLPLDLLVYEKDSLRVTKFALVDHDNDYFRMIHSSWGERLRQVFAEIPDPQWTPVSALPPDKSPMRSEPPLAPGAGPYRSMHDPALAQTLAQSQPGAVEPG
ncbi:proteasome-type protease [Pigmentiphaga sp.]|mgnify:CR=1 FL=1|uniref:proteasome-type protease n=1 Tax=Pigmentiphaga sp. TaxID=1977564 RepID=UPI0025FD46DA|nr:proteasome-type protease [Pigmentiphaga sp.]MBX6318047.1 proteasome-type protease [Pigmentiphaga sp.]